MTMAMVDASGQGTFRAIGGECFRIKNPQAVAAVVAGIIDISVGFSYLLGVDVSVWYAVTLGLKAMLVLLMRAPGRKNIRFHSIFLASFTALLVFSCWLSHAELGTWLAAAGFILHLGMTLAAVRVDSLANYLKAIAYFGAVLAVSYDIAAFFGQIEVVYGRYSFFGGNHPNLGSEILAMSTVAACMSLDFRRFLLVAMPALVAIVFMQGRAALLVVLLTIVIRFYQAAASRRALLGLVATCVAALLVTMAIYAPIREWAFQTFNMAFMLGDPNRGLDTGFVGREDLWMAAWNDFLDSPLVGQGFGYYTRTGAESAHNFYMYALVEFGLISALLFSYAVWCLRRAMKARMSLLVLFTPILALTIFNDRFININPYPFVMIAVLLLMAASANYSGILAPVAGRREPLAARRLITGNINYGAQ